MADSSKDGSARATEEDLRLLIDQVKDYAIFRLDPRGTIVSWNKGAELINGYKPEEVIGKNFEIFYDEQQRASGHPQNELRTALKEGRYQEEGWRVRKDGSRFRANVTITAIFDANGKHLGFGKVTRDLTREEEARAKLEKERIAREAAELSARNIELAFDRLRRLQAMSAALSEAVSREEVSDAVVRHGAGYLEADAAAVLVPSADGSSLEYLFGRGYVSINETGNMRFPLNVDRPAVRAFNTGEPFIFSSRAELFERMPSATGFVPPVQGEASALLPLEAKGARIGVLALTWQKTRTFDDDGRAFLRVLALHAAAALDRANLYAALDGERRRLAAVIQQMPSAVAIVEAPSGRTVLANAQNNAIFKMSEPDSRKGVRNYGVFKGLHPDGRPLANEDWPLSRSLMKGEIIKGEEIHVVRGDGTHGFIRANSSPVRDEAGNIIAAVVIYDDITEQRRTEDDVRFLSTASKILSSSLDWQTTLRTVCDLAVPTLADWCAIEMVKGDGTTEQIAVAHVDPAKVQLAHDVRKKYPPDPKSNDGVRMVIQTGKHILVERITDEMLVQTARDEEHLRISRELGIVSAIVVPIPTRRGIVGAFTLISAEQGRTFTERDVPLFLELGQRAGLAIENARLFAEAQVAIQKRDDFLSVASHELKTPLTSLDLNVESLKRLASTGTLDKLTPEKLTDRLSAIERQSDRLRELVEDLLDVARITAGRLQLAPEPTDLGQLVEEIVRRFAEQAARAGCELKMKLERGVVGNWDRNRIDQVVVNFLTNAVKYGAKKPVEITVDRADGKARFSVRDYGIGIAKEDQARIFERFERATSIRSFGGIGLGLWICKQIVDAHKGVITVQSAPGEGATFTMELPLS